ncbi:MAG: sortase [Candidatus Woesebacteria bacterium]|nr:MAG: sortase [Candidatus Woesebacteria bacterium]
MNYINNYPGYIPATDFSKIALSEVSQKSGKFSMSKILKKASLVFAILGILVLLLSYGPSVLYKISAKSTTQSLPSSKAQDEVKPLEEQKQSWIRRKSNYQPPKNSQLSNENRITISSIGVNTAINEAAEANYEDALKKGVWRDPSYGTAYDRSLPLILAAHRFGYLSWDNTYRHLNSFYNLPRLQPGDTVEITWRQRKYIYAIYGVAVGENVSDFSADLILYTCNDLNSPVRVFAYGKLLEI